jgi:hypothetical protein
MYAWMVVMAKKRAVRCHSLLVAVASVAVLPR